MVVPEYSMVQKITCPKCKGKEVIKWSKRKTENRGLIQRYKCKHCNSHFTPDDGFFRMRNSQEKITLCLDLFYRGVSTRKVQEHLQAFYTHNSSWVTIYSWVLKYSKQISSFTDTLKLKVGSEVQVDEVEYHRRRSYKSKRGTEINWFIDSIDTKTRFMVASNYCKSRGKKEIKQVMKAIKDKTETQIKVITTDGLLTYPNIIKSVFGYSNLKKEIIRHNRINASKGEGFNYPIERLHNNVRARTKTFRGFHGSIESANAIMKGYEIYYNFITKHQALNHCPYELAIPELALSLENEKNRWLGLIKLSNLND